MNIRMILPGSVPKREGNSRYQNVKATKKAGYKTIATRNNYTHFLPECHNEKSPPPQNKQKKISAFP